MTGSEDAVVPHAAAEQDPRDPSRAANQVRDAPIPPSSADSDEPTADSTQPAAVTDDTVTGHDPDRPQAGVPDSAVTDTTPALGTSEESEPVLGVHTPDVGPGGKDFDTADSAERSRAAGTS